MIPRVYAAINAVAAELAKAGIAKNHINAKDSYDYRSIDDVMVRLSPILAAQKLCILPRVVKRECTERTSAEGELLISVSVRTVFDIVSAEDGSSHSIELYGEALDHSDKGTAKALSAAYKQAVLQAFCIPISGTADADEGSHRLRRSDHVPEPPQGWGRWSSELLEIVRVCETEEALERVQNSNRVLLKAVSAEQPKLYVQLGEAIQNRRRAIATPPTTAGGKGHNQRARPSGRTRTTTNDGVAHA